MSPAKRFLLILAGVYLAVYIPTTLLFGPPGMSGEYLERFSHEHEHYLEVIKSPEYKLWQERPHLHEASGHFAENIAFVEQYTANEAFQEEMHRRHVYEIVCDWLNMLVVVVVAVRFGRKPLLGFLDGQIAQVRERLDRVGRAQEEAAAQRAGAEAKVATLEADTARIAEQAEATAQQAADEFNRVTGKLLSDIDEEEAIRKALEEREATRQLRKELVDRAIALVSAELESTRSVERQNLLVDQFLAGLEKAK